MKTGNVGGSSKTVKHCKGDLVFSSGIGGSTPPQSRVQLLPIGWNRPFIKRFKEWWTK